MLYNRKAYGPHRRRSRQALARDIAASILAAQQRGEQRPITSYTQHAETIRLVEKQLAEAARESELAQGLEKHLVADAKDFGEFLRVDLANRPLAAFYLGNVALRDTRSRR